MDNILNRASYFSSGTLQHHLIYFSYKKYFRFFTYTTRTNSVSSVQPFQQIKTMTCDDPYNTKKLWMFISTGIIEKYICKGIISFLANKLQLNSK